MELFHRTTIWHSSLYILPGYWSISVLLKQCKGQNHYPTVNRKNEDGEAEKGRGEKYKTWGIWMFELGEKWCARAMKGMSWEKCSNKVRNKSDAQEIHGNSEKGTQLRLLPITLGYLNWPSPYMSLVKCLVVVIEPSSSSWLKKIQRSTVKFQVKFWDTFKEGEG